MQRLESMIESNCTRSTYEVQVNPGVAPGLLPIYILRRITVEVGEHSLK